VTSREGGRQAARDVYDPQIRAIKADLDTLRTAVKAATPGIVRRIEEEDVD
jgi:hypothetical protein